MADTKLTALTAMTTPTDDDVIYIVQDPGGTPVSNKLTMANLKTYVGAGGGGPSTEGEIVVPVVGASSTVGATVTASATPHTKGTAVELVASSAFAAEMVEIYHTGNAITGTNTCVLVDLMTDASLATVTVPNLQIGTTQTTTWHTYRLPVAIPSGTRIGARIQGTEVSETASISIRLHQAGSHTASPSSAVTYGADTATSNGFAPTAPASANTKGAWLQLGTTSAAHTYFTVTLGLNNPTGALDANGLIDIATDDDAGAIIIHDFPYFMTTAEQIRYPTANLFTVNLDTATPLWVRYQASSTSVNAKPTVIVHGF